MIVEDIIHSGTRNYTKLAFNSFKIIQNDAFLSQSNGAEDDRPSVESSHTIVTIELCTVEMAVTDGCRRRKHLISEA